jgi:hypothetical protein
MGEMISILVHKIGKSTYFKKQRQGHHKSYAGVIVRVTQSKKKEIFYKE